MGTPSGLVVGKQLDRLDRHCRAFVALSPFVLVGTCDSSRACDVSPSQAYRRRGLRVLVDAGIDYFIVTLPRNAYDHEAQTRFAREVVPMFTR